MGPVQALGRGKVPARLQGGQQEDMREGLGDPWHPLLLDASQVRGEVPENRFVGDELAMVVEADQWQDLLSFPDAGVFDVASPEVCQQLSGSCLAGYPCMERVDNAHK